MILVFIVLRICFFFLSCFANINFANFYGSSMKLKDNIQFVSFGF